MKKGLYTLFLLLGIIVDAFSQSMSISGGNDHSLFICTKGVLYACGDNTGGRLGLTSTNSSTTTVPSFERVDVTGLSFSQVTAGSGAHNVALACNGLVYCWGSNGDQMPCGQPANTKIVTEPTLVLCGEAPGYDEDGNPSPTGKYLGGVKFIAASTSASFAILEDGTAVGWGGNGDYGNGQWIQAPTQTPKYIRDENGDILKGVTHIAGGDNNCLLLVDPDGDGLGTAYSIGNVNGRGGLVDAQSYFAAPVLKMKDESAPSTSAAGDPLDNIKMLAAGDEAGFAVDGITGYVYAWGTNGGCNRNGLPLMLDYKYAAKMAAGDYQLVSGEAYLTNVVEVIGGNGYGAAVTQEGYMLYWGKNNDPATVNWGGVIPDPDFKGTSTIDNTATTKYNGETIKHKVGPVFAKYKDGSIIKDAVHIARGDLFGFMVNSSDKYYVWGQSNSTAMPNNPVGCMATGVVKDYKNYLHEISTPCAPADPCPTAYMVGPKYKCPGSTLTLYSGFTPSVGKEDVYEFTWYKDGVEMDNTVYNTDSIKVDEPGEYQVKIVYKGSNTMCATCEPSIAKVTVADMEMPIDPTITEMNCVTKHKETNPTAADKITFQFTVNNNFYKPEDLTTWVVYDKKENGTPIDTINGVSVGDEVTFEIPGDKVTVNENIPIDTTYSIWVEDATRKSGTFFKETVPARGATASSQLSATQPYYILLDIYSDITLDSFDFALSVGWNAVDATITPIVYKETLDEQGNSIAGDKVEEGKPAKIKANGGNSTNKDTVFSVDMNHLLLKANPVRGSRYYIFFEVSDNVNNLYSTTASGPLTTTAFGSDVTIKSLGVANSKTNFNPGARFISNFTISKLTDYTCGRIELSAKYGCPPCDSPKDLEIIASETIEVGTGTNAKYKKVINLCKESNELILNIEELEGKANANTQFDIYWSDKYPVETTSATPKDVTGDVKTLEFKTDWATVAEDGEKVYYVLVRDHKENACDTYDSIKVIAHPVPADTLVWDTFCLTSTITEPDFTKTALGNTITWTTDPTGTFTTLTDTKSFDYTVTDAVTGCISETHTYTVTVNKTDVPQVDNAPSTTVDPTAYFDLNSTRQGPLAAGFSLRWYDDSQVLLTSSETNISRANEGSLTFYVEMYNEETQCASEKVEVVLTINDALPPDVHDESLCIDDVIDLANYVTINKKTGESDSDYELLWYTDPDAPKGTGTETSSFQTTFTATAANAGTPYEVWVSQKNVSTNAESEKKKITITVHKVATLDLTANTTTYCVYETANAFTATENNDGDFTGKKWSTSKRNDHELSSPQDNLSPTIQRGAPTAYYVLPYFENPRTYNYASDICYGTVQEINVTVNYTEIPNPEKPTVYVQYLQAQGDANGGRYNKITVQDPLSVTPDNSTDYELVWYNESGTEIPEPAPTYNATEPAGKREEKFQVAQRNKITGCISEKKDVIAVISTFPMPTTQALSFCQESDELKSSYILTADINTAGGIPATEYTLVWYKEDPEVNPGAAEYAFIDLNAENLTYDYASVLEKDTIYYVRQRHARGDSPASPLVVTIFSKPRLLTDNPDPICLGDQIDIRDYYSISNKINNKNYDNEYLSGVGGNDPIAKKHGEYRTRAYFTLSSGETCYSDWAIFNVTVNELSVKIDGEQTTCPGISKELTAVLDTNHMFTDVAKYTWNGVQSNNQTFTSPTATNGQITVTLDVEMGACRATAPAHTINVVNPGLNGDITFTERGNTKNGTKAVTQFVEFEGCGTTLNFELNVDHTEDAFTYKNLSNNNVTNSTFESGKAFLTFDGSIDAGMYEITYTNVCETSFVLNIEDRSHSLLGFATSPEVCEGDPWEITIKEDDGVKIKDFNFNPSKHTIRWKVGSTPLPQFDNSIYLKIPSTTSADNGFYSYTVTSAGCVYTENVPKNKDFISRPIVTIDSASLENNGVFEVVRGRNKDLTIPLLNPTSAADLAKLNIVWNELKGNSYEAIAGETSSTYSVSNVDEDHYYKVNFAGGKRSGDHDFCGTSIEVSLKVDAELAIKTEVVGDDRNKKTDMCIGEENVGILIDTAGTGTLLHPDKLKFRLEELIPGKEAKKLDWVEENGKLFAEINPSKSAGYRVIYEYTVGNQKKLTKDTITVHPAYEIEWDKNVRLCDGSEGFVQITKIAPSEVTVDWEDDDCLISGSNSGANVKAIYEGKDTKEFILVASNGGICDDKRIPVSVKIDKKIEGEIKAPEIVCEGNVASLTANYDADIFLWKADDDLSDGLPKIGKTAQVTSKPGYAHFIVVMQRGACSDSSDVYVEVTEKPKFEAIDSLSYKSVNIVLQGNTGTAPYKYIVDDNYEDDINSSIKVDLDYGQHKVTVIDTAGCVIDTMITINFPSFNIPIVVSPNGDNHNDAFTVPVLRDAYPDATIRIFDRWGKKLADYKAGDGIDWDGTYNGVAMPTTDYWYEIEIKEIKKTYSGHFTLIRQ